MEIDIKRTICCFCLLFSTLLFAENTFGTLTEPYFTIINSGKFHIKAYAKMFLLKFQIDLYTNEEQTTTNVKFLTYNIKTIMKNENIYLINDKKKSVSISKIDREKIKTNTPFISWNYKYITSGVRKFNGKKLTFEEYEIDNGKLMVFVEDTTIVGITMVTPKNKFDLIITEFDQNIPSNIFNIPNNYNIQNAHLDENGQIDFKKSWGDIDFPDDLNNTP
jgi:hypothetical protein